MKRTFSASWGQELWMLLSHCLQRKKKEISLRISFHGSKFLEHEIIQLAEQTSCRLKERVDTSIE